MPRVRLRRTPRTFPRSGRRCRRDESHADRCRTTRWRRAKRRSGEAQRRRSSWHRRETECLTARFPRCLQGKSLAWSLQPVQWVRRLQLAAEQQRNPRQPLADQCARVLTAAAIIVLHGRRTYRTLGGESNRLLH